eukprot:TRINITY_DN10872_c0_g1_i1.p1 TRINITY_DN10872_c0_g1~~TRINITY_DN10872_c0_g1_i1.p1  ORF type:complete len:1514 (+),score=440.07 TRINITY_DN10872_c0_g1_i1:53-4594(+)
MFIRKWLKKKPKEDEKVEESVFDLDLPKSVLNRSHIMLDKLIYKPGTTLRCRVLVIDPVMMYQANPIGGLKPWSIKGEILDANDSVMRELEFENIDSIFFTTWDIPSCLKCGSYRLKVSSSSCDISSSTCHFQVLEFSNPRMSSQIEFDFDSYAPGQSVSASLLVKRLGNDKGPACGISVSCESFLDGKKCFEGVCQEIQGNEEWAKYKIDFKLPEIIDKGVGTLSFRMKDGEILESRSKTIPIVLQCLDIRVFPEGGEFVKGLSSRLYIEAYNPHGEPADISGDIVDKVSGEVISHIETYHEGRGRSDVFKPLNDGCSMELQIHSPIEQSIELTEVKPTGVTLGLNNDICLTSTLSVNVASSSAGQFKLNVWRLTHKIGEIKVNFTQENEEMTIPLEITSTSHDEGVLRVCISDAETKLPLAERLAYRVPRNSLEISVEKEGCWAPGSNVSLKIKSELVNEEGKRTPTVANLFVNVTDESVRQKTEKRELAPSLASLLFLDAEVDHLEDSEAYLNANDDEAPLKMDLLLGTQGWRRFIDAKELKEVYENIRIDDILAKELSESEWKEKVEALMAYPRHERKDLNLLALGFDIDEIGMELEAIVKLGDVLTIEEEQPVLQVDGVDMQLMNDFVLEEQQDKLEDSSSPIKSKKERRRLLRKRISTEKKKRSDKAAMVYYKRIYAHKAPTRGVTETQIPQRNDFTETIYWAGVINTQKNGEQTVSFDLSESVTTFKVMVDGLAFTSLESNGAIGSCYTDISSNMKFSLDAQLPIEVSEIDLIKIPVLVHVDKELLPVTVQFIAQGFLLNVNRTAITITEPGQRVILHGKPRLPKLFNSSESTDFNMKPAEDPLMGYNGVLNLGGVAMTSDGKTFWDGCQRKFRVKARGFTEKRSLSTLLDDDNLSKKMEVYIPLDTNPNSMMANISLSLTPIGNLASALKGLIKEPFGCFEQTSSTTYPLVMALTYFKSHSNVPESMISAAMKQLSTGYQRLISYECESGGFEWFGRSPALESLTAYGLLQFEDMSSIYCVNSDLIERTRDWLLSRRDPKSGKFSRNSAALDGFGFAPPYITNAYILYALTAHNGTKESRKDEDFGKEIEHIVKLANGKFMADPYFLALVALVLFQCGDKEQSLGIAKKLSDMQIKNTECNVNPCGSIDITHSSTSITNSYGNSLCVETTAMVTLAWMNFPKEFGFNCFQSVKFLHSKCSDGTFGSTQSTVLALKAIIAYDEKMNESAVLGKFWIKINGKKNQEVIFDSRSADQAFLESSKVISAIKLGENNIIECGITAKAIRQKVNKVEFETRTDEEIGLMELMDEFGMNEDKKEDKDNKKESQEEEQIINKKSPLAIKVPLSAEIYWRSNEPGGYGKCPIIMDIKLMTSIPGEIQEGGVAQMCCNVKNETNTITGMVVAIIGIPGGLEVRFQRLKELVKMDKIAFYEIKGRELVFYWRNMKVDEEIEVMFDVIAKTPGNYIAPASRCYMYYCSEDKFWMDEQELNIVPIPDTSSSSSYSLVE